MLLINTNVNASNSKSTTISSNTNLKINTTVKKGTIIASSLNVRSDASLSSEVLTSLKSTTSVEIIDTIGEWYKIKLSSSFGYVSKQYVKVDTLDDSKSITSTNNNANNSKIKKGIVTASHLNVRDNASLNSQVLTALNKNLSVEIVDTIGSWYKIKLGSSYGYVFKEYITIQ